MINILVVEDDENLAFGIKYALEQEGWNVTVCSSLTKAYNAFEGDDYHLILLDVMLPDGSGFDFCKKIRRNSDIPIIFLTARDEEVNVVMGLESGGDDYVTKPFRLRELISRIRANLRKHGKKNTDDKKIIKSKGITLNLNETRVFKNNREVSLTPTEFRILHLLLRNPGVVFTREKLLEKIWDIDGNYIDDNTLSVHIRKIREKIEDNPSKPDCIETVRGLGYRWNGEEN
ncbi:MAG: response regulator transcription factor [Kosmotoga sp.]|nr:MAG: response regulator transcription factor [Kosmotoga sp.]